MTVQCEVRIDQGLQAHVDAGVVLDKSFGFRSSQWLDCKKIVYVACQSFELLVGVRNPILLHIITVTLSCANFHFTHIVTLVHTHDHMSCACPGLCTDSVGI